MQLFLQVCPQESQKMRSQEEKRARERGRKKEKKESNNRQIVANKDK